MQYHLTLLFNIIKRNMVECYHLKVNCLFSMSYIGRWVYFMTQTTEKSKKKFTTQQICIYPNDSEFNYTVKCFFALNYNFRM